MKHLHAFTLTAALALAAATPAHAQTAPDAAASAAAPAAVSAPTLKVDVQVVNPEDLLDTNKTLLVPTLYLSLLTEGRVSAGKQSGFFSGGNATARAAASYKVAGLDKAYAQQLAQAAYDDFVAQLRQAGYTVLTYADVKDREVLRGAQRDASAGPLGLPTSSEGGNSYILAAPSDEQLFKSGFAGGAFSEFQSGGKSRITDATIVIPHFTFNAPQAWTETSSGYKSVSAEANIAEGMNLLWARAHWMGQPKSRMMRGIPGVATKAQVVNVSEKAGAVTKTADTTPQTANAVSTVLSLFGAGNVQRSSSEYLLTIDREAYARGVLNGVRSFNAEVARAAAAATP
ncbi:MAG: hypothetical protein JNM33_14005 [Rubrivivax sp.]|nr:hypothetical protein [Rubrivivax sp.]